MIVKCYMCHKDKEVHATPDQIKAWQDGQLIQNAMPNVSADERELLISGICGQCFDNMFHDEPAERYASD